MASAMPKAESRRPVDAPCAGMSKLTTRNPAPISGCTKWLSCAAYPSQPWTRMTTGPRPQLQQASSHSPTEKRNTFPGVGTLGADQRRARRGVKNIRAPSSAAARGAIAPRDFRPRRSIGEGRARAAPALAAERCASNSAASHRVSGRKSSSFSPHSQQSLPPALQAVAKDLPHDSQTQPPLPSVLLHLPAASEPICILATSGRMTILLERSFEFFKHYPQRLFSNAACSNGTSVLIVWLGNAGGETPERGWAHRAGGAHPAPDPRSGSRSGVGGGTGWAFDRGIGGQAGNEQERALRLFRIEGGAPARHHRPRQADFHRRGGAQGDDGPARATAALGFVRLLARLRRTTGIPRGVLLRRNHRGVRQSSR